MSVIVLSRFPDVFAAFKASIDEHEPEARKLLVRNSEGCDALDPAVPDPSDEHWSMIEGAQPFCFSRNVNAGLSATDGDVLVSNDDVTFYGPVLGELARLFEKFPKIGILSPRIDGYACNPVQRAENPWPAPPGSVGQTHMVAFICVYLRRAMLESIGMLDEGYVCSWEDNDLCMRAREAGWGVCLTDSLRVRHGFGEDDSSVTVRRLHGGYDEYDRYEEGRKRFAEKWGSV